MEIGDLMKHLAKKGILTSMHYDTERDQFYVDLETQAKSFLYLYEDGMLRGRYQYEKQIDLSEDAEELVRRLCHEFNRALHGRNFFQGAWADLCRSQGIKLNVDEFHEIRMVGKFNSTSGFLGGVGGKFQID